MIDFDAFDALTFDCYGTLIDWETGILAALRAGSPRTAPRRTTRRCWRRFARHEARLEAGPYLPLRRRAGGLPARARRGTRLHADRRRGRRLRALGRGLAGVRGQPRRRSRGSSSASGSA